MNDRVYEATCGAMAELVAHGVTHAVVSPGSRSTPLTIAARWTDGLEVSMHLDERSAGFHALGIARVTGRPAVLICTSGTAAANYLPAVMEAHYAGIPLLVFTADRPPELRDWGAGQTVNQVELYGSHVRHFAELPVAGETEPIHHRLATVRAVDAADSPRPGPVHLNWPFREPLEPIAGSPPVSRATVRRRIDRAAPTPSPAELEYFAGLLDHPKGLIVAGPADLGESEADAIGRFAAAAGWPVIAEPLSQLRRPQYGAVANGDHLLKHAEWADRHVPNVVVRIGNSPTSKPLRLWLERNRPLHHVLIDPDDRWNDATFIGGAVLRTPLNVLADHVEPARGSTEWTDAWHFADGAVAKTVEATLADGPLLEPIVARTVAAAVPSNGVLYVSNSMPVRDLDAFTPLRSDPPLTLGNRGASGIDGVISSAAGAARSGRPTVLLIGDVATVHDFGGLVDAARRDIDLTLVVPNNDGGGIFSFLPIAGHDNVNFDELFHTAHGTPLTDLPGVRHRFASDLATLIEALGEAIGRRGVDLIEVPVDKDANLAQHRALTVAIAATLAQTGPAS